MSYSFRVVRRKANGYNEIRRKDENAAYDLVSINVPTGDGGDVDISIEFTRTHEFNVHVVSDNYELAPHYGHSHRLELVRKKR